MKRIPISESNGKWFDADKAELFKENQYHDGKNWISEATNSQWLHEAIYLTRTGVYVLNCYSDSPVSRDTYKVISMQAAANWFSKQWFPLESIPDDLLYCAMNNEL